MIHIRHLPAHLKLNANPLPHTTVMLSSDQDVPCHLNTMEEEQLTVEEDMSTEETTQHDILVPALAQTFAPLSSLEEKTSQPSLILANADLVKSELTIPSQD